MKLLNVEVNLMSAAESLAESQSDEQAVFIDVFSQAMKANCETPAGLETQLHAIAMQLSDVSLAVLTKLVAFMKLKRSEP